MLVTDYECPLSVDAHFPLSKSSLYGSSKLNPFRDPPLLPSISSLTSPSVPAQRASHVVISTLYCLPRIMNRPNGQQCLAKTIIDHTSLWSFNTNGYIPVDMKWPTTHRHTDRQCPILCLARFTEPLPDNHIIGNRLYHLRLRGNPIVCTEADKNEQTSNISGRRKHEIEHCKSCAPVRLPCNFSIPTIH